MVQELEILKGYITCEDAATRNKFFNLLDSFWHKKDGKVLKETVIGQDGSTTFRFLDDAGNITEVSLPALPNSKPISFITGLQGKLDALQPKVNGKGLSTNDLTTDLLNKLTGLENYIHPEYHQIAEVFGLTDALAGKADAPAEGYGFSQENYSLPEKNDVAKIPDHAVRIGKLEGMDLVADMANQKILVNNSAGELITEISVAWLNNEGTVFSYNATTEKLELKNDAGELLAEVPVSAFVSNLASSIDTNGTNFQLKDTEGNVISSVVVEIANINGLTAALGLKANNSEVIKAIETPEGITLDKDEFGKVRLPENGLESSFSSPYNLLNLKTFDDGYFVNHLNGVLSSAGSYTTSDFTEVKPNKTYNGGIKGITSSIIFRKVAFYDAEQTFISGIDGWSASFTTPVNCEYVKISTYNESGDPNYSLSRVGLFEDTVPQEEYFKAVPILKTPYSENPNSLIPKKDLLIYDFSVVLSEAGESYISTLISGKQLKQSIRAFSGNVFDFLDVHYDGAIIKRSGDDAAPYRIDNSTLGANHSSPLNYQKKFYIDGKEISDYNRIYYPYKSFTVKESYDIQDSGAAAVIARVSISYEFDKYGGCTIYTDFLSVQDGTDINNIMFTQASVMDGNVSYYIPKTLPVTQDSVTYDFSSPYDMSGFAPANRLYFSLSDCEPTGILPDRVIMLRNDIGFAHGYLPLQDAGVDRRREVIDEYAIEIRNNTKKSYPNAIDRATGSILNNGEYYSVIAYRNYFIPKASTTSSYMVKSNKGVFIYLDWHTSANDDIELPTELSGKSFEIVEKSIGVTILSKENSGLIRFNVNQKGYAILKFADDVSNSKNIERPIKTVNNTTQYTFIYGDQYKHIVFTALAGDAIVPDGMFSESDLLEGTFIGGEVEVKSALDGSNNPLITLDYPATLTPVFAQKGLFGIKFTSPNSVTLGGHQKPVE